MTKPKVLLVEDDEALAATYRMRLEAEGYEVQWTANGEDALAQTLKFNPELILLDIMMPRISGFDVLDILRNTPETKNIKILILSALSSPNDIKKATDLGANGYLIKGQTQMGQVVDQINKQLGI